MSQEHQEGVHTTPIFELKKHIVFSLITEICAFFFLVFSILYIKYTYFRSELPQLIDWWRTLTFLSGDCRNFRRRAAFLVRSLTVWSGSSSGTWSLEIDTGLRTLELGDSPQVSSRCVSTQVWLYEELYSNVKRMFYIPGFKLMFLCLTFIMVYYLFGIVYVHRSLKNASTFVFCVIIGQILQYFFQTNRTLVCPKKNRLDVNLKVKKLKHILYIWTLTLVCVWYNSDIHFFKIIYTLFWW